MHVRLMAILTVLLLLGVRSAAASTASAGVPADGTYAHGVHAALAQADVAEARDDSLDATATLLLAGGAAVGLAALFVINATEPQPGVAGSPFSPPGGVTVPEQEPYEPPKPFPMGNPGQLPPPNGPITTGFPGDETGIGTTVTPEPITMALLASGLAGMGGAGVLRRRRSSRAM